MDTTETVTHVSLCAGYGGIDLGLKRAVPNLRTIAFSEIEAFACANLVAKMEAGLLDAAPIWTDLKTFPWDSFHGKVHVLSGGYPCQPFSAAGLRKGADDPRHLWPFIADGIGRMRPELCFFENVEGHVSLGLREVIGELESLGYRATWGLFSAAEVGAPHQRKRVFIMAHRNESRLEGSLSARIANQIGRQKPSNGHAGSSGDNGAELADTSNGRWREDRQQAQFWASVSEQSPGDCGPSQSGQAEEGQGGRAEAMANANGIGDTRSGHKLGNIGQAGQGRQDSAPDCHHGANKWPSRPGQPQFGWEPPRVVGLANATGERGGSESGDAVHQGRTASEAGSTSLSQDAQRQNGASITNHQSAGNDAGLANAQRGRGEESGIQRADLPSEPSGSDPKGVGNASDTGRSQQFQSKWTEASQPRFMQADALGSQAQSSLGGDADGAAGRLDYAELCRASDNRTDELRLLGNGVVPATAERAFRVLAGRLFQ